jgi:hypothetical protein
MFRQTLIILITTTFFNVGLAQNSFDNLKVFKVKFDSINKAPIIPDSVFSMQLDILHLTYPGDTTDSKEKYGYEIWWPSTYNDGSLVLTITKRQIYLRSGHNNPNPNYLYWLVNITDEQYKTVDAKIKADKNLFKAEPSEFSWYRQLYYSKFKSEKGIPRKWTKKKQDQYYKDWLVKKYKNTDDLISFFDNGLTSDNIIPFVSKEDFEKNNPVRIAYSEEDYESQIKIFVPPKIIKD